MRRVKPVLLAAILVGVFCISGCSSNSSSESTAVTSTYNTSNYSTENYSTEKYSVSECKKLAEDYLDSMYDLVSIGQSKINKSEKVNGINVYSFSISGNYCNKDKYGHWGDREDFDITLYVNPNTGEVSKYKYLVT